ncbi:MAG: class I SAM-dependent methyltransferase [Methylocystaceae bacterium]|nr:class I SAM-dependent methyltransferase [Methylocystaceae bacterium]
MKNAIREIAQAMHQTDPESSFAVRFWDDELYQIGDTPAFTLWFKDKDAASRTLADGFLGFGEGYMTKGIEVEGDLQLLFKLGFLVGYTKHKMSLGAKIRILINYFINQNTLTGSRKNISHHYDVGNDFYERILGPSMAYTCAYYKDDNNTLEEAQNHKFDLICRKLRLKEGESLVDFGCGWASLLIYAAQNYGINGVGVTLSKEQYEYGMNKIANLGLQDRIRVELKDYRDLEGQFDKVVSVGMLEHVGLKFLPVFFKKVKQILKPGSLALIHMMGNDELHDADPWTEKYMFPGGQILDLTNMIGGICNEKMNVIDVDNLRLNYEQTIFHWLENFTTHIDWISENYGEELARSYYLYFHVSAASFRYGDNRLFHILFSNGLNNDMPLTREYMYNQ